MLVPKQNPGLRLTEGQRSSRTGCWGPLMSRQEACVESSDHRRLMAGCESCSVSSGPSPTTVALSLGYHQYSIFIVLTP
ncbi:uncharacterized protein IAS62_002714 [Cryptococcus decagattii]|uniref:Uncharacterized protein n=1 Tax=Cryptococcus decagattii TaxID=1859122 RepID=A0ABZ2AW48_9TREE